MTDQLTPGVGTRRRRRRPSGEPPPLPRSLNRTSRFWARLMVGAIVFYVLLFGLPVISGATTLTPIERTDAWLIRLAVDLRTGWLTSVMRAIHSLGSDWAIRAIAYPAVLVPLAFKRVRHALIFFASYLAVRSVMAALGFIIARPRPLGVPIIGDWKGYSHPSLPVATLAATLIGALYALVPRGRWRQYGKWLTTVLIVALSLARVYLAVDNPFDVLFGAIFGVTIPLVAFRLLAPYDVFPVTYRRGRSAHLDVTGPRGAAIRTALEEQLGVRVRDLSPFGLGGSAGSTPLRIELEDEKDTVVFGKLYAATHLRADRSYKLGRTLLYGRLEDESSFNTVRRLVQYEDYLLRVMRAAEIPVAEPYGFVELTPEREYLLVTEFCAGAVEIGDAEVISDELIDHALTIVRRMWEAGLAHRDVKPSNVLVRGDQVLLIDVAFGEVRPSAWRQAVDLANMMLTLSLKRTPGEVYERALHVFSPDEIAEAFAATRGVTSPSQLRSMMRAKRQDLIKEFRSLAPHRPPIRVQRWSVRRVMLLVSVAFIALFFVVMIGNLLTNTRLL